MSTSGYLILPNIEELRIEGEAFVDSITAPPRIAAGEGSAVTGRFVTRQVDLIARVEVLGADGQIDTIEGTTIHPIWSLDRNDWVPLGELEQGEQLHSTSGAAVVLTHAILQRSTPVYNIEVHGQHVYQVGWLGLLVHNACEMYRHALQPFRGGFTNAGRALTKHPNIAGAKSTQELIQIFGNNSGINNAAAEALKNIMRNGTRTTKNTKAFGEVIDFRLANGLGARFNEVTKEFIGFLGRGL